MVKLTVELIDDLEKNGHLKPLISGGFIHPNVILFRNIYRAYNYRLESTNSKMQAMEDVSQNFGVSFETVRKARRVMTETVVIS